MPPAYRRAWLAMGLALGAVAFWALGGRAWYRRLFIGLNEPPESERRASHFVAASVPRLSRWGESFTMRPADFDALVRGLSEEGYVSIGFSDVRDFYLKKRPLPDKAVLIALDRDDPSSVAYADGALSRVRMKAGCFLNKTDEGPGVIRRHSLTPHAVRDLTSSGAWEFGWSSERAMPTPPGLSGAAVLVDSPGSAWLRDCARHPFRFETNALGYDGPQDALCGLRMMRLRGDRTPQENLRAIDANWPRTRPFFDDFRAPRLGPDWIPGWGVISSARNRLAVIPTPRQTSASVSLNGTQEWTDQVVEITLKSYRRSFWIYLRYKDGRHYVRVGAKSGLWKVEQKAAADLPPQTLADAPITGLPARLQVIIKNQSLLVHVNDRFVFGRGQQLDARVDAGAVALVAFDPKRMSAIGVITSFRAAPLPQRWLALDAMASDIDWPTALRLHDLAVLARALSPRWYTIGSDGHLLHTRERLELLRSLSGFNRCLLAPTVDFEGDRWALPDDPAARERLILRLAGAVQETSADGVNLRVPAAADPRSAAAFAAALRDALHARRRLLWVTLEGPPPPDRAWDAAVDGVLLPEDSPMKGAQTLELYDLRARAGGAGPG